MSAISLHHSLGLSTTLQSSLFTLPSSSLLYAASHTPILLDTKNTQTQITGHQNTISAIHSYKEYILSADTGPANGNIIVWKEGATTVPVRTLFLEQGEGVLAARFAKEGQLIIAIIGNANTGKQYLHVYEWTANDKPVATTEICTQDIQICLSSSNDADEFMSNGKESVWFYYYSDRKLSAVQGKINMEDFPKIALPTFVSSVYLPGLPHHSVASTTTGQLALFVPHDVAILAKSWEHDRALLKFVQLGAPTEKVTSLSTYQDRILVVGFEHGAVALYDFQFRILNHYPLSRHAIKAVSIPYASPVQEAPSQGPLSVKFHILTGAAEIVEVSPNGQVKNLVRYSSSPVTSLYCHPAEDSLFLGNQTEVQCWDLATKTMVNSTPILGVSVICGDAQGRYLAVGSADGRIQILSMGTLQVLKSGEKPAVFNPREDRVRYLEWLSETSTLVAAYDRSISVIKNEGAGWELIGSLKGHHDLIIGLTEANGRLWSIGRDGRCLEYDLNGETIGVISDTLYIDLPHKPTSAIFLPAAVRNPAQPGKEEAKGPTFGMEIEESMCVSTDGYKVKLFNTQTQNCRRTVRDGGSGKGGYQYMKLLPRHGEDNRIVVWCDHNKLLGLSRIPLSGNPHESSSIIAHASGITALTCTPNGEYVITAGGKDGTVHIWSIDAGVVEASKRLGGADFDVWASLLPPDMTKEEIEEYFCFVNLRRQGEATTTQRQFSERVHIDDVGSLMNALGFYPTKRDMDHMINEIKYGNAASSSEITTEISINDVIRLFVNHKEVEDLTQEDIESALSVLKDQIDGAYTKEDLVKLLQVYGEPMDQNEFTQLTQNLLIDTAYRGRFPETFTGLEFSMRVLGLGYDVEAMEKELASEARQVAPVA